MLDNHRFSYVLYNIWAIPQKRLPQGEKMKVTYKVCFPLKINEEGLHFDDEVKTF